jgi:hypothetical protein
MDLSCGSGDIGKEFFMKKSMIRGVVVAALLWAFSGSVVMAGMAPENPVHEKRKELDAQKKKEIFGFRPQPTTNSMTSTTTDDSTTKSETTAKANKNNSTKSKDKAVKRDPKLVALMKEFDTDGDGVISYEEMEAADAADKGDELRALLAAEKAKTAKKTAKTPAKKTVQESESVEKKETINPDGSKDIIITPTEK